MKLGDRIALLYTLITVGTLTLVSVVFYVVFQYLVEIDFSTHGAWILLLFLFINSLLIYFVGKIYTTRIINQIDTAYQSERSFIRNASHEINNPLTAIQGECEISLLKERTPAQYKAALHRISSETKRIIELMKHLLFLSRGENELLQNAVESIFLADFMMQFSRKRIQFSPDSFAFVVNANPYLLRIAIENIVNNACKYSDDKLVEIRLRGNTLEIEDQGIGIPSEELLHINQPFYRATNARVYAGNGIGLSLSLRILRIYGAEVTVTSVLNKGTKVRIDFR